MATELGIWDHTHECDADFTAKLGHLVKHSAVQRRVSLNAAATTPSIGVLCDVGKADAAGKGVTVRHLGIAKVKAGGTIAAGDKITSDANGKGIVTTTAGHHYIGFAKTAAVADDLFAVHIQPGNVPA